MQNNEYSMILTNCRDDREAEFITQALFDQNLVACVQANKVSSHFFWKGTIRHDSEIRLMIKTRRSLYPAVEACIRQVHSYELPEIVEVPIMNGSQTYLQWVDFATKEANQELG